MANINRNFGKLIEGALTYAPSVLVLDGRTILNPNAESYKTRAEIDEFLAAIPTEG